MREHFRKKLRSQAGETIAEVLVALLISVLGVALLVGMIGAATRIIDRSTKTMQTEYQKTVITSTSDGRISVYLGDASGSADASFEITDQKYNSGKPAAYYTPKTSTP